MTATVKRRFSAWQHGLGALALSAICSLSPWTQAHAAPNKKVAKTAAAKPAAKPAAKAAPKTAAKPAGKASPQAAAKSPAAGKTNAKTAPKTAAAKPATGKAAGKQAAAAAAGKKAAKAAAAAPKANAKTVAKAGKAGAAATKTAQRNERNTARGATSARLQLAKAGNVRSAAATRRIERVAAPRPRLSIGQMAGLRGTSDPLDLSASVAFVMDQDSHEVLLSKNEHAVLPIASLTKLMTALIVSDARLPLDEMITITHDDVDTAKGSRSRLPVGTTLTRGELMHLALMSSENRAAHALGRTFPGGMQRFVSLMNARAIMLGMKDTRYVEPTGLSSANRSSAQDLATLVSVASENPLLRQMSTSPGYEVAVGERIMQYGNTNRLVHSPDWQINLQKTGYISEAGRCLVMQTRVAGRNLIMVFLDANDKQSRLADAERVRRWVEDSRAPRTLASSRFAS